MSKSLAVAQYLLDRCKERHDDAVTPMQLLKLVYIAHGYMLGEHGEPLLDEPIEAWQYGPVVRSVYDAVRAYRSQPVEHIAGARRWSGQFKVHEQNIMAEVAEKYGAVNGVRLSAATPKSGTPWSVTWERNGKNSIISNDLIEDFYDRLLKQPKHSAL